MVLIKKSKYLPHFLKYRTKNSNGSFLVSYKEDDLGYFKNKHSCLTVGSHHKIPPQVPTPGSTLPQGPTSGSHPSIPPKVPTLASQSRVSPQGPTLGSHPRFPPQDPTPGSHRSVQPQNPTLGSHLTISP